jgi:hypothetical protein
MSADKLSLMVWPHTSFLVRKAAGLLIALAVLVGAGGWIFAAGEIGLQALRKQYHRPAHSLSERRSLFESQVRARPHPVLRSDLVRIQSPLLRGLSQSRPVMGRRRTARRRREAAPLARADAAQYCLDVEARLGRAFSRSRKRRDRPLSSPDNMDLPVPELIARLSAIPGYVDAFNGS